MTTVTRPLSAGRITMSMSFLSRLRACCSSLVKLLSCSDADCIVEAILLLMLSLLTECFSPYDSARVSFLSKGREEMFLTQLSSGFTSSLSFVA